jgi:hypothetical protein
VTGVSEQDDGDFWRSMLKNSVAGALTIAAAITLYVDMGVSVASAILFALIAGIITILCSFI